MVWPRAAALVHPDKTCHIIEGGEYKLNQKREADFLIKTQYEKPEITTYSEEEILELIGPANTVGSDLPGNGKHLGWGRGHGNPHN